MKKMVAFDLDGTLALSKQPLDEAMASSIASLLEVADVSVISGGDWPQFEKQVIARLPNDADVARLWIMPTTGTKLFRFVDGRWHAIYADVFDEALRAEIIASLDDAMRENGFDQGQSWGERIEDRGTQITFSGCGQEAPLEAKEAWDPDRRKREAMQKSMQQRLPDLSINIGGSTSIDITRKGIDKAYGIRRLIEQSGIAGTEIIFIGDAIYPGGNDYAPKEMGIDSIRVHSVDDTRIAIEAIRLCVAAAG